MSLLSYDQICNLIEDGVIEGSDYSLANSASLDIRLGRFIEVEQNNPNGDVTHTVVLGKRDALNTTRIDLRCKPEFILSPGDFILAQSKEIFHLPNTISAEYKLKSSMARIGLEHLNAGWCDAGWHGSVLTLELKNMTRNHWILLREGDKIGQMVFFKHLPVPADKSYAARGSYNGDKQVQGVRKERYDKVSRIDIIGQNGNDGLHYAEQKQEEVK